MKKKGFLAFLFILHRATCLDEVKLDTEQKLAGHDAIRSLCDELRGDMSLDFVNSLLPECEEEEEVGKEADREGSIRIICEDPEELEAAGFQGEEDVKGSCSALLPQQVLDRNAETSLLDLNRSIRLNPSNAEAYETRGKVYLSLGRLEEAWQDLEEAIELEPSAERHNIRGGLLIRLQKYREAYSDFDASLKLKPDQADILHLRGLALYNQGRMKESLGDYTEALRLQPDSPAFLASLGLSHRELGDFDSALVSFNGALAARPLHCDTLYLRGALYHYSGRHFEALQDFEDCVAVEPAESPSVTCWYGQALSHGTLGEYYQAVKSSAQIMATSRLRPLTQRPSHYWVSHDSLSRIPYLKEYFRYLHSCLDRPVSECRGHLDFSQAFQEGWAKALAPDFLHWQEYSERPGLSPLISDVQRYRLEELPEEARTLIATAKTLGNLTHSGGTEGGQPHPRSVLANGLAALEVAQRSQAHWNSLKKNRLPPKEKRVGWRDLFRIGLAWTRLVDVEQPMLWLDHLIAETPTHGYNNHIYLNRGQVFNSQYSRYYDVLFDITKRTIIENRGKGQSKSERDVDGQVRGSGSPQSLLETMRRLGLPKGPGFLVSLKVPSVFRTSHKKILDGLIFTIALEEEAVVFSMDMATADVSRTKLYHRELDSVWAALEEQLRKAHSAKDGLDYEAAVNLILSLGYYFYNLMPISRQYSLVGYSVMMGLLLSMGREVTGHIPPGKLVDLEFMLSGEGMIAMAKNWMKIQRREADLAGLPRVTETFPTLRTMIEALNTAST